jgi:hypothetical protein
MIVNCAREIVGHLERMVCIAVDMQRSRDGYIRFVSGQRLGKYAHVARQQILNNVTVGLR